MTQMAPGWYRDPGGAPVERWWDGGQWTPHTQPPGIAAYQEQMLRLANAQARSSRATGALARIILWALGAAVAIVVLVAIAAYVSVATH